MIKIVFNAKAKKDLAYHQKSGNKPVLNKIFELVEAIQKKPFDGIGKPEALKYELTSFWSRRINKEHRLVYKVYEEKEFIEIYSLKGHY